MINLPNGLLVETPSELPDYTRCDKLFLDVETQNNTRGIVSDKVSGLYPFKGDRIAGFSFKVPGGPAHYAPIRHKRGKNLPLESVQKWLADHLSGPNCVKRWINHSILLDAAFVRFDGVPTIDCELFDTLTMAKVHDSDRIGHGLDDCVQAWKEGGWNSTAHKRVKAYLDAVNSKSYADVPTDIMGWYACGDVIDNEWLYDYLVDNRAAVLADVWDMEVKLTSVLHDAEMDGLAIDPLQCKRQQNECLKELITLSEEFERVTDREWTNSFDCVYDVLINRCGLPVLVTKTERNEDGEEVDTGRATFDKLAIPQYRAHPMVKADPKISRIIDLIVGLRREGQYKSLFLDSFLELYDVQGGLALIHPTYNQVVRTGRMSCKRPNAQQQNSRSKQLIHPRPGCGFISADYSQIEFRMIAHYIDDAELIRAYNEDPDVDFHKWVAQMCKIKRRAGKTMNFRMAFGAGKRKVVIALTADPDVMEEIGDQVNRMVDEGLVPPGMRKTTFESLCEERALKMYHEYHERIPGIKRETYDAAAVCRRRGFVINWKGRVRTLPLKAAHKAFNTVVQGGAMDIMKERMVATSQRFNRKMRDWQLRLAINVHDEVVFEGPQEVIMDPEVQRYVADELQTPSKQFKVPISCGMGVSLMHWSQAAGDVAYSCGVGKVKGTPEKVVEGELASYRLQGILNRKRDQPGLFE